jgi:hypothetical protein
VVHRLDAGVFAREVGALLAAARWSAADLEQILVSAFADLPALPLRNSTDVAAVATLVFVAIETGQ